MADTIARISIDYTEPDPATYRGVELKYEKNVEHFASDNPAADFQTCIRRIKELLEAGSIEIVMRSSSCDHFVMDGGELSSSAPPAEHGSDLPPGESFYMWKEYARVEGWDDPPRLLTPWADPREYEYAMDWIFKTPEAAKAAKEEHAPYEDWVLVHVTYEPIELVHPRDSDEEE